MPTAPELVAPAGSLEKLELAYRYGADAAYIGVGEFSLRTKADSISGEDASALKRVKGDLRLYGALNIYFHEEDLGRLEATFGTLRQLPLDALVVSDPGAARLIGRLDPKARLHLSTQANCVNSESAKLYRDLGFSRIILGRELTIEQVERIRRAVPDVELEVFVHGAMCIAYSGRCYLSRYMAERSANRGDCAHSCRWEYRLLEEAKRPGEYFPVQQGDRFTTIFSSKDLCMIDHLSRLAGTGIDACKIEGRMKSAYYTAITSGAYRAAIDAASSGVGIDLDRYRRELSLVSHREFSTGFYFGDPASTEPTMQEYERNTLFLAMVRERLPDGCFALDVKNHFSTGTAIELVTPTLETYTDDAFGLIDASGARVDRVRHGEPSYLKTHRPIVPGTIIRSYLANTGEGAPREP